MAESFIRRPDVKRRYGSISDSTLYRWIRAGLFPRPIQLGPNTVAWRNSDLDAYDSSLKTIAGGRIA